MAKRSLNQTEKDRQRRMQWWHEAKFGLFVHWGLYSVIGRHEWVMELEGIPVAEYEKLAPRFKPKKDIARTWPGSEWGIGGLRGKIKSAHLLCDGSRVEFEQDRFRVRFSGLPNKAPDAPVTVLALEFASEPRQDMEALRIGRKREGV